MQTRSLSYRLSFIITCTFAILLILLAKPVYGAEKYERKSISFINTLWLATPEAKNISSNRAIEVLNSVKKAVDMERFDYNPLPDNIIQKFTQEAGKCNTLTSEKAKEILGTTVVTTIIKILNENMEFRAKELITETEQNSFITLKANELGLAVEHFEKILDSAYIYLPILTSYSHKTTSQKIITENLEIIEKQGIEYSLSVEIIWFSLKVSNGKGRIESIAHNIKETGIGWDTEDSKAFTNAAKSLEDDLQTKVAKIPDFRLRTQVFECSNSRIGFNLGKRDGIKIDQKFRVYEEIEDAKGNYKLVDKGFFIVCQVGDNTQNKNALSYGKPIIGKYDYGMIVEEIPSYNIEILCRINKHSANIGIQSRETKTSQYYVTAGVSIGRELDNPYVGIYGAGIKKYYFGQFAFLLGYKYDYQKNGEAVWPTGNHLLSITTGLEVALSANVYFGTMVDLRVLGCKYIKASDSASFHNPFEYLPVLGVYTGCSF